MGPFTWDSGICTRNARWQAVQEGFEDQQSVSPDSIPKFKLAPGNFHSARTSSAGSRASPLDWMYPDAERQLATWISAGGWVHRLVRACGIFTKIGMICC